MKRRTILQGAAVAAGMTVLGLPTGARAEPFVLKNPFLEVSTVYSPETRPHTLVTLAFSVEPGDLKPGWIQDHKAEAEAIAKSRAEPPLTRTGFPKFELYSCPIYRRTESKLVANFRRIIEHFFEVRPGYRPVLFQPVEFDFRAGSEPWLAAPGWLHSKVVTHAHDVFVKRSFEVIEEAVFQRAVTYHHHVSCPLTPSDWRDLVEPPMSKEWLLAQRESLTSVIVRFFVDRC